MQLMEPSTDEAKLPVELADGSRLVADQPLACRVECAEGESITLADLEQISGQPFAGYRLLSD